MMTETDFQEFLQAAIREYAEKNDLPITVETIQEKGYGDGPGIIVQIGEDEFSSNITQLVFEGE